MGSRTFVEIIYANNEGEEVIATATLQEVLEHDMEHFIEQMEKCTSGSCFNESRNHCDCDPEYEDYDFKTIRISSESTLIREHQLMKEALERMEHALQRFDFRKCARETLKQITL